MCMRGGIMRIGDVTCHVSTQAEKIPVTANAITGIVIRLLSYAKSNL